MLQPKLIEFFVCADITLFESTSFYSKSYIITKLDKFDDCFPRYVVSCAHSESSVVIKHYVHGSMA